MRDTGGADTVAVGDGGEPLDVPVVVVKLSAALTTVLPASADRSYFTAGTTPADSPREDPAGTPAPPAS